MKAETRERAAWRTFGLLPREEQEAFDAAAESDASLAEARDRMESLAAAVSVIHSRPVTPDDAVLGLIKERCGLSGRKKTFISSVRLRSVLAWAGWGVAAALAVLLAVRGESGTLTAGQSPQQSVTDTGAGNPRRTQVQLPKSPGAPDKTAVSVPNPDRIAISPVKPAAPVKGDQDALPPVIPQNAPVVVPSNVVVKQAADSGEKRRLIQELETLQAETSRTRQRDVEMLSPAPGRAWPLIVEMKSPTASKEDSDPPIATRIGDALAGKPLPEPKLAAEGTPQLRPASAIPVYDPSRDTGTLAVMNLPVAVAGSAYNLWVSTADSTEPVLVGMLPDNLHSTDSFDFSLGSTGIVPTSYYLTLNSVTVSSVRAANTSLVPPNADNIVLQGP